MGILVLENVADMRRNQSGRLVRLDLIFEIQRSLIIIGKIAAAMDAGVRLGP
jgi:hypothetical protein